MHPEIGMLLCAWILIEPILGEGIVSIIASPI